MTSFRMSIPYFRQYSTLLWSVPKRSGSTSSFKQNKIDQNLAEYLFYMFLLEVKMLCYTTVKQETCITFAG
jgi:hypothetical protein